MRKIDFDAVLGLVGVTAGLMGVGYALGTHSKMAKISEKLDRSIEDLASDIPVDIPSDMVNRAVEKAVAYEVKQAVSKVADDVKYVMKNDIHTQVSNAVDSEYSKIKDTVLEELVDEASKIDAKRVRSEVERAAKQHAIDKFDENLDDILDDFKENLSNTRKIYKSFAEAAPREERVIRIG